MESHKRLVHFNEEFAWKKAELMVLLLQARVANEAVGYDAAWFIKDAARDADLILKKVGLL